MGVIGTNIVMAVCIFICICSIVDLVVAIKTKKLKSKILMEIDKTNAGNKILAEFMGIQHVKREMDEIFEVRIWTSAICNSNPNGEVLRPVEYHKSWEWLMPVVDKIEELGFVSTIERLNHGFSDHRVFFNEFGSLKEVAHGARNENKLTAVYEAVLDFIEWHNNKKK